MSREIKLFKEWQEALKNDKEYSLELDAIKNNKDEITDRFYTDLNFGTAGLRGVMGLGTNRINLYTIGQATQGLANYALGKSPTPTVAIGYDSRNNSKEFAVYTAMIFAANNITTHLYPQLAPTPAVAYAVRELGCNFGVVITASHNPKQYNGYKVFGSDGCQIDDDVATSVFEEIQNVNIFSGVKYQDFELALKNGSIKYIDKSITESYLSRIHKEALKPEICSQSNISLVYTPLNGAGNLYVRKALDMLNVKNVYIVPQQEHPDGNFPTTPYPNPEFPEALELGLSLAKEKNADFLLATDPDADRAATAVLHGGDYIILSGNQMGVLLLDYIAKTRTQLGTMPIDPIAMRSIVSTKLTDKVAGDYNVKVRDVLTGFKFIGEVIRELEDNNELERFIFGFEEANGFLIGTHVRDKDAVVTSILLTEMLSALKLEGKTAVDRLWEIQEVHGYYSNMAQNIAFEGAQGMEKMNKIMDDLRNNPLDAILGRDVVSYLDYWSSIRSESGDKFEINTRPSNVLEYRLEDGCSVIIRPSGTEPKLKIYYSLIGNSQDKVLELEKEYAKASVELTGVQA